VLLKINAGYGISVKTIAAIGARALARFNVILQGGTEAA
jgi:hypothetical protein